MGAISDALQACLDRIAIACAASGRGPDCAQLMAVSKTFPASAVRAAHVAGQVIFGESYLQEALDKQSALADLKLEWHFIGPIQSNKTRPIAEHFQWVHSIDRDKVARRLSDQRPAHLPPLDVCIQVNISGEASKSGIDPEQALALAQGVAALPRLRLRGFMAIPEPSPDQALRRARFNSLSRLLDQARRQGMAVDTLSMGMSDDLEEAILEGATIVRVGTAIFGARDSGHSTHPAEHSS